MVQRQEPRMMAEVPLTGHARGITLAFEHLGERRLAIGDPHLGFGPECAVDANPVGIAAGQERSARGRTDRLGNMEIGEPSPFSGEPVEIGRLETLGAETADVARTLDRR